MDAVRRFDPGPLWLWVAVNALNILDAALTTYAIDSGVAREANPVIDVIGLNGKITLVAIASALLALVRPKVLLIPIIALGIVVLYSVVGVAVSA